MAYPQEQIDELRALVAGVMEASEGGATYFLLPGLLLPEGCAPAAVDALLCPTTHNSYPTRLFVAQQITPPTPRGLGWSQARILDRVWHVLSWRVDGGPQLRLVQMVAEHLRAFR